MASFVVFLPVVMGMGMPVPGFARPFDIIAMPMAREDLLKWQCQSPFAQKPKSKNGHAHEQKRALEMCPFLSLSSSMQVLMY